MGPRAPWLGAALAALALVGAGHASPAARARAALRRQVKSVAPGNWVVAGKKPWLFWTWELRHYAHARFWGPAAKAVAENKRHPDPLAAIVAYQRMFKHVGVQLLVVPVPGKVLVYGDKLVPPVRERLLEGPRNAFFKALRARGVRVVDILPLLRRIRASGKRAFLARDTHWSAESVRRVAELLGRILRAQRWYRRPSPWPEARIQRVTEFGQADLAAHLADERFVNFPNPEPIQVWQVRMNGRWVGSSRHSPVVLAGDSYTVVFHSLLGHHGGLADQLAAQLGYPVDQVGLAGVGAVANSFATLARRHDNLRGKKVVILCFAERGLDIEPRGWPVIPVVRR